ncbi:hypothetical protein B0T16DRAFT_451121 [Cercophora newfieldiana]|uniref:DUF7924 domain-containing protein n=1 Tax=Cercophora newfieldiana TaxID=92897 RepID=A0AA39YMU8_9PEZI|nr:hypothetical protein B0T16DRAFT_451121 [Cercophora newfieldiana]
MSLALSDVSRRVLGLEQTRRPTQRLLVSWEGGRLHEEARLFPSAWAARPLALPLLSDAIATAARAVPRAVSELRPALYIRLHRRSLHPSPPPLSAGTDSQGLFPCNCRAYAIQGFRLALTAPSARLLFLAPHRLFFIMDGPSQPTKRRLETPSLPTAKQAKTDLQQPAPKHPEASFLKDQLTDTISKWLESIDRGADGYAPPPTPSPSYAPVAPSIASPVAPSIASPVAPSIASPDDTGSTPSSGQSVKDPAYRFLNLAANDIYMRPRYEPFPEHVANVVDYARKERDSPGPSPDDVYRDRALGALEIRVPHGPDVKNYFRGLIFPELKERDSLKRIDRLPMFRHLVPSSDTKLRVSNPAPDMLYGYSRHRAFPNQQKQLISMRIEMDGTADSQLLMYPFFVIEFKGEDLWVATNKCFGGSASCVNIAERLNLQLKARKIKPINSTAFSIAMSGTEARLYVSWKHSDLGYYMQKVDSFLLQKPQDYIEFRKHVKNIIDWGKDQRLKEIRESLALLEESRNEAAKSRPPV